MNPTILLEARNLSKSFWTGSRVEIRALKEISVTIAENSFTVLTGPSGSGKTTLLSMLATLDRPSAGQIFFQDQDLGQFSDVALARLRRRFGFVFQNYSLIPGLPVWENITYQLIPLGVRVRERWALAQELLSQFGLADKLLMRPGELSGGEQQRIALARALAGRPEVIFADEPISNLDKESSRVVLSLLEGIHAAGKTVVLSMHDASQVNMAGRIYELEGGRVKP
jgi:putative ABC transport system ATP-binding protein